MGALTECIDGFNAIGSGSATILTGCCLGIGEVGLSNTEKEEIGIRIGIIVPNAPVSLKIVPFCHGKTECETAQIAVSVIKCTIETVKDGTVIISCCRHILARSVRARLPPQV